VGALLRIAGGLWIGFGVLNLATLSATSGVTTSALLQNMVFFGIPGLLLLIIGIILRPRSPE
jgi:hypothetical protein